MAKPAKRTKKFEKKHLGAALSRRKKAKPIARAAVRKRERAVESERDEDAAGKQKAEAVGKDRKQGKSEDEQHKEELEALKEKDPAFYEFLKEHDKELLDFEREDEDEEDDEDVELGSEERSSEEAVTVTRALLDEWCEAIRERHHYGSLKNFLQAFRSACHHGDGEGDDGAGGGRKYVIASSHVFNKVMVFGLSEMDGVFRRMLGLPAWDDEKKAKKGRAVSSADELQKNKKWKNVEPFVKAYLGNALNIFKQMTDGDMIAFTLRRLKVSIPFMGPFPKLCRKSLRGALHFWSTGDGVLPALSLLFVRDMALRLGEHVLSDVLRGVYREFAASSKFVNQTTLPQIGFRTSCVVELYGIDLTASYQLAFVYIQQMAKGLRSGVSMNTKTAFRGVYCWQYINCLRLWVKVVSAYPGEDGLRQLVYPLVQILGGVAQLVPTVGYFPLRLQCAKMLNELQSAAGAFTPVAPLLLDMLHFKELFMAPTGGVGKASDFDTTLKVPKSALRTQKLQEDCVEAVLEQLAIHLEHWSYAVAFPELAVIPVLQLRQLLKATNVDRFCRKVKQLVDHIERNVKFVLRNREKANLSLGDSAAISKFLEAEKKTGASPLSQYVSLLRQRASQAQALVYKDGDQTAGKAPSRKSKKERNGDGENEDRVEDLVLSSDEE